MNFKHALWRRVFITLLFILKSTVVRSQVGAISPNFKAPSTASLSEPIFSIAATPEGSIVLAGSFSTLGTNSVRSLARLKPDGSLDPDFYRGAGAVVFNPGFTNFGVSIPSSTTLPNSMILRAAPGGGFFLGGDFNRFDGVPVQGLVKLTPDGRLDTSFEFAPVAGENVTVTQVEPRPDGSVLLGGVWTKFRGVNSLGLTRLDAKGLVDPGFKGHGLGPTNSTLNTRSMAVNPDGSIWVNQVYAAATNPSAVSFHLLRLKPDGTYDNRFDDGGKLGLAGLVTQLLSHPEGGIVGIGGGNYSIAGQPVKNIFRIGDDGQVDTNFTARLPAGLLSATRMVLEPGGEIVLLGFDKNFAAAYRLKADGSTDTNFVGPSALTGYTLFNDLIVLPTGGYAAIGLVGGKYTVVKLNGADGANSRPPAPLVTLSPNQTSFAVGESLQMFVGPIAGAQLQWRINGVDWPGITNNNVNFFSLTATNSGTYVVRARNANGFTDSDPFTLVVTARPRILTTPGSIRVVANDPLLLTVRLADTNGVTFQWYRDSTLIPGATGITFSINQVAATDAGNYRVEASNSVGTSSAAIATILVIPEKAPVITRDLFGGEFPFNSFLSLFVETEAEPRPSYQWFFNGQPLPNPNSSSRSFTLSSAQVGDYQVVVSNRVGQAASRIASIKIKPGTGDPTETSLTILSHPGNFNVIEGQSLRLGVTARGTGTLRFQWRFNGTPIVGAGEDSYRILQATADRAGAYSVQVSDDKGSVISREGTVVVNPGVRFAPFAFQLTTPITSVSFGSSSRGCFVARNGAVYGTTNGGTNWSLLPTGVTNDLSAIQLVGPVAFIAGANGLICVSTNGGSSWSPYTTGTTQNFYGLSFLSPGVGIAVGGRGTICRYNGTRWVPQATGVTNDFFGIAALADGTAWAGGSSGILCRYNGTAWNAINSGTTNSFFDVSFLGSNLGFAVGANGLLCRYRNGAWSALTPPATNNLRRIRIASATTVYLTGDRGLLCQSSDGGDTWVALETGSEDDGLALDLNGGTGFTYNGGRGSRFVAAALPPVNRAPSVRIIDPGLNYTNVACQITTLRALASDPDGSIAAVDFYVGTTRLGGDVRSPYTFRWTNDLTGAFQVYATTTDNLGAVSVSDPVSVTVVAPQPNTQMALGFVEPGNFEVCFGALPDDGIPGAQLYFESSTNLLNWVELGPLRGAPQDWRFNDTNAITPVKFYRVHRR